MSIAKQKEETSFGLTHISITPQKAEVGRIFINLIDKHFLEYFNINDLKGIQQK